jgi:hypothetical protein
MPAIDIDCFSLNFTKESHEFMNPWTGNLVCGPKILPMTLAQQKAAIALVESYGPILHEETGQLFFSVKDGGQVYVDAALGEQPGPVHLKIAVTPKPTLGIAQFVFDFAVASEMALMLENVSTTICVAATPVDHIPAEWPAAKMCQSPEMVRPLLEESFQTHVRTLERLKKQWS